MIRIEDPRFKNLERKIGIFIVIAMAGIAVSFYLFGVQKDFFTPKYSLRFTVDRGTGFTKGMAVKLSGFRIGRITSIALNDQAMVDITVEIDKKYSRWIRNDSTVKLVKEGLVGDSIVDVAVGSLEKPELQDKESIVYLKTKGLDEMADEITEKVKPVLIEVRDIISYINDPQGDLKKTIRNLELLTRNLETTRQNTDRLLINADTNISRLVNSANSRIDSLDLTPTINRLNSTLDHLDKRLPPILDNVNAITLETRRATEKTLPRVPGMVSQAEDIMQSSDRLLNSIQNSWLIGGGGTASAQKQGFIKGDSYE
ncbi:MAG TPA: MlaD family protein [Deltaproteobacteria bacterium]|nr:MlaD family protein [Deltaproteobacteria bacterium]HQB39500.1 MlaD family protein [Deltaproteobacteria bacterium]